MSAAFKTDPLKHQLKYINKSKGREAFANFSEMGTGKTWCAINEAATLWGSGSMNAVLVIAPNGVHSNWVIEEIPKHMPDWVRYKAVYWSASANAKEQKETESILKPTEERTLRILAINWDSLQSPRAMKFIRSFILCTSKLMIIADESHFAKNPKTQRAKALLKLKPHAKYRRIMSGSPFLNSPFDLFSQFLFLDETILGTSSFYAFKAEYAELLQPGNRLYDHIAKNAGRGRPQIVARGANNQPIYRNLDKLRKLIEPHSFRVLKTECLDLPDKVYTQSWFDLTPKLKEAYKRMKREARMILDDSSEQPVHKLAALMKLSQICSGFLIDPDGKAIRLDDDNPKLELLKSRLSDIMENSEEKVIVWARFQEEIDQIKALCIAEKFKFVEYHGRVKQSERREMLDAFKADARIFIGNPQSGGTGLNLTSASYVIYYSNSFNLAHRLQSEDRAHRIGQSKKVVYEDLISKGTIDVKIVNSLKSKKDIASLVVGDTRLLLD